MDEPLSMPEDRHPDHDCRVTCAGMPPWYFGTHARWMCCCLLPPCYYQVYYPCDIRVEELAHPPAFHHQVKYPSNWCGCTYY